MEYQVKTIEMLDEFFPGIKWEALTSSVICIRQSLLKQKDFFTTIALVECSIDKYAGISAVKGQEYCIGIWLGPGGSWELVYNALTTINSDIKLLTV